MADRRHVMILHGGGLRSLVTTAMVLNRAELVRLTLLHITDGRDATPQRLEHVQRQADHYALRRVDELNRDYLYDAPTDQQPDGLPRATLAGTQMMLTAMAHAIEAAADELLWPIAVDGDTGLTAAAQERQIVCSQLAEAETAGIIQRQLPEVTTPLLGYRDTAVVELGSGLGVPWELAWGCVIKGQTQCGSCPACRRRRAAFRSAGVVDPIFAPAGVR